MSLKVRKSVTEFTKRAMKAWPDKFYKAQRNAFLKLQSIEEFKYVVSYWELEAETAMSKLSDPSTKDVDYERARYSLAIWFLKFLDNIVSDTEV